MWQINGIYLFVITGDLNAMIALQPALKFNGGGHINHTIFWTNLSPSGGGEPTGICYACGIHEGGGWGWEMGDQGMTLG